MIEENIGSGTARARRHQQGALAGRGIGARFGNAGRMGVIRHDHRNRTFLVHGRAQVNCHAQPLGQGPRQHARTVAVGHAKPKSVRGVAGLGDRHAVSTGT